MGLGGAGICIIVCGALTIAFCAVSGGLGSMIFVWGAALVMISVGSLLIQGAKGVFWLLKKSITKLWNFLVEGEVSFREAID